MRSVRRLMCCGSVLLATSGVAVGQDASNEAVMKLVKDFVAAEKAYDAASLDRLISDQYVEISPAGEVDAHDRFLSFYAPEKKIAWPPMTISDEHVRMFGSTAVEVMKFTYQMPGANGQTRPMQIRGSFVAQRNAAGWRLIAAQYTGIRPTPPDAH